MPDQKPTQPSAVKEPDGSVHIELDAPAGSITTQPVGAPAGPADPQTNPPQSSDLGQVPPPPIPPPADQMARQIQQAAEKELAAKQTTQEALQSVKQSEETAKGSQEELKSDIGQAQQQLGQAEQQIQEAQSKQQAAKQQVSQAEQNNGLTIAGYKPADLAQALVKPPEPASPPSGPRLDPVTQQQIKSDSEQVQRQVQQTQQQIKEADKQVSKAQQSAEEAEKSHESIIEKITSLIQELTSGQSSDPMSPKPYSAFMILGAVCLILALLILMVADGFIWILLAVVAAVELGIGVLIKKQSQG